MAIISVKSGDKSSTYKQIISSNDTTSTYPLFLCIVFNFSLLLHPPFSTGSQHYGISY